MIKYLKIPNNTNALLHLLCNSQEEISGSELGKQLGISRTAVWKKIKELQTLGVNIISTAAKGYRLAQPITLLKEALIKEAISDPDLKQTVQLDLHLVLPSTNDYLKSFITEKLFKNPANRIENLFILSEHQPEGRGRLGRKWHTIFGANIACSSVWYFEKDISELGGLSLIVSLSIISALQQYGIQAPLYIKWPNDIICQDKKMAGILIDVIGTSNQGTYVLIGVGLNVNMLHNEKSIGQPWTSLQEITGNSHDRNKLIGFLINQLYKDIANYRTQGFNPFLLQWQQHDYLKNKIVKLQQSNNQYHGKIMGIDQQGHLLLQQTDSKILSFAVGDATLCK